MSKPYTGYLIPADSSKPMCRVELSGDYTEIQTAINARHFDVLAVCPDVDFFVDDEGLLVAEPQLNERATRLFIREVIRQTGRLPHAGIYGDVLLTGGADEEGYTVSISENRIIEYNAFLNS